MAVLLFGLATVAWWALCYWAPNLLEAFAQALVKRRRDDA